MSTQSIKPAQPGRHYPSDYCLMVQGGHGACLLTPGHGGRCKDANGYLFDGRRPVTIAEWQAERAERDMVARIQRHAELAQQGR